PPDGAAVACLAPAPRRRARSSRGWPARSNGLGSSSSCALSAAAPVGAVRSRTPAIVPARRELTAAAVGRGTQRFLIPALAGAVVLFGMAEDGQRALRLQVRARQRDR